MNEYISSFLDMSDFLTIQQKIDYARRDFIEISGGTNNSVSWDKSGRYRMPTKMVSFNS